MHLKQKKHQDSKISFGMERGDWMRRLALFVHQFNSTLQFGRFLHCGLVRWQRFAQFLNDLYKNLNRGLCIYNF